jgi:hypothetical protein
MLARKDDYERPKKGIIFCRWNECAYTVFCWIEKVYNRKVKENGGVGAKPLIIYGSIGRVRRQALVKQFQEGDDCNLLVGVTGAIDTGLTFTRASWIALFEQESEPGT